MSASKDESNIELGPLENGTVGGLVLEATPKKMLSSVIVSLVGQVVIFVIQLAGVIILARLLTPTDYGHFSIAMSLALLFMLLKDGFALATIQKEDLSDDQVNSLFWLNCLAGSLVSLLFCALAPIVASIYKSGTVSLITAGMTATVLFAWLGNQHRALLRRQLRFGAAAVIDQVAAGVGTAAGVAAALFGLGVWALVIAQTLTQLCTTIGVWIASDWRPGRFSTRYDTSLLHFSKSVVLSDISSYVARNVDSLLIGWSCGSQQLGFYDRAYTISQLPLIQGLLPIMLVAHSSLSRMQNASEQYRLYAGHFINAYASIGMLAATYLYAHAGLLMKVFLGDAWLPSGPVLQALAPSIYLDSIIIGTHMLLLARAKTQAYFKGKVFAAVLAVVAYILALKWGPVGVAIAFSITRVFVLAYGIYLSWDCTTNLSELFLSSIRVPFLSTAFACLAAVWFQHTLNHHGLLGLLTSSAVFFTVAGLSWMLSPTERARLLGMPKLLKS